MRKLGFFLTIFSLMITVGAGCSSSPSQTAMNTYQNKDNGFEIQYPKDWSVKEGVAGIIVGFLSPDSVGDTFTENIIVDVKPTTGDVGTYVESALKKAPQEYQDFKLIENKVTTLAGETAKMVTYTFTQGTNKIYTREVFAVKNGKIYDITFTTTQENPTHYWDVAQKMIESFRITQ
jgi:hypothetical protein